MLQVIKPIEYDQLCDLIDEYFTEVRQYNSMLGAFDMTADMLKDARQREALHYARIRKVKDKLIERGIHV